MGIFDFFKKPTTANYDTPHPLNILSVTTKASAGLPKVVADYESGGGQTATSTNAKIYGSSDLVNSCVNYIAETGALSKFTIHQLEKDGSLSPVKDKRLRRLFDVAPNDFTT